MALYQVPSDIVDAVQYTGEASQAEQLAIAMFTNVFPQLAAVGGDNCAGDWTGNLLVITREQNTQVVFPTDWILTRQDGSNTRYRLSNEDFLSKYVPVT